MTADEQMRTQARVCAIDPEGQVELEFLPAKGCRGCEGACNWFRRPAVSRLSISTEGGYAVGQRVLVGLPARYVLYGAALMHGLPWLSLLAGASVGALWGGSDLSCFCGAAAGLTSSAAVVGRIQPRLQNDAEDHLNIVARQ